MKRGRVRESESGIGQFKKKLHGNTKTFREKMKKSPEKSAETELSNP